MRSSSTKLACMMNDYINQIIPHPISLCPKSQHFNWWPHFWNSNYNQSYTKKKAILHFIHPPHILFGLPTQCLAPKRSAKLLNQKWHNHKLLLNLGILLGCRKHPKVKRLTQWLWRLCGHLSQNAMYKKLPHYQKQYYLNRKYMFTSTSHQTQNSNSQLD